MKFACPVAGTALAALLLCAGGVARASEGERALSVNAGYATYSSGDDRNPHGGAVGVGYEYSLSDALWLRGAATGGAYVDDGSSAWSSHATFGVTYVFDVLRYVPYANIGAGVLLTDSGADSAPIAVDPIVEIGVGLDVLSRRERSYGGFLRVSALSDTTLFWAGARVSWRSGFF